MESITRKHEREEGDDQEDQISKRTKDSHDLYLNASNLKRNNLSNEEENNETEEEADEMSEDVISQHANDHINLTFIFPSICSTNTPTAPSSSSSSSYHRLHPNFTHQLFPNELISYLSREEIHRLSIDLQINTVSLQHDLHIDGIDKPELIDRIKGDLQLALPSDAHFSDTSLPAAGVLFDSGVRPVGKLLHSFTRPLTNKEGEVEDEEHYELYLSTYQDEHANSLLVKLEKIALWFIETADSVDFSDPRWELLLLYQIHHNKHSTQPSQEDVYSIVGYMTLFTFHNPFHGDNLRVCQALVFPHKQHSGLGRELLLAVYRLAEERKSVNQVTVEDPSPGFQRLRNAVDFEWYALKYSKKEELERSRINNSLETSASVVCTEVLKEGGIPPLPSLERSRSDQLMEAETAPAAVVFPNTFNDATLVPKIVEELKIIKNQAIFVKEAYEYIEMIDYLLHQTTSTALSSPLTTSASTISPVPNRDQRSNTLTSSSNPARLLISDKERFESMLSQLHDLVSSHPAFPDFRLAVKKNIVKNDAELKQLPKQQLQRELSVAFEEKMMKYRGILNSAIRLQLISPYAL